MELSFDIISKTMHVCVSFVLPVALGQTGLLLVCMSDPGGSSLSPPFKSAVDWKPAAINVNIITSS